MYFCIQDRLAIRSLIDGLRMPLLETRVRPVHPNVRLLLAHLIRVQEVILDMFFDLLNIRAPDWHQAFIAGRRLTSTSSTPPTAELGLDSLVQSTESPPKTRRSFRHCLRLYNDRR